MRLSLYGAVALLPSLSVADIPNEQCPAPAYNSKCACHQLDLWLYWCGEYPEKMQPVAEEAVFKPFNGRDGFRLEEAAVSYRPNTPDWDPPPWVEFRCLETQSYSIAKYKIWRSPYYLCQGTTEPVMLDGFNEVKAWAEWVSVSPTMDCVLC
ncbi:hypothetical protein GTA08_BOTSDO09654 [Botryosphaeria dothidea]|uniref:Uncharacterized protein n=1 Tax=Botryosphaeria dothidea TaxID=55169 RepID=A0A8H4IKQ3_9PEZI|nr:hypothetical protein GTA08_BOTSDO09654 [Botryosphaeria dothidea]